MSSVRPKKHLGQHFLKDLTIADNIANGLTGHGDYHKVLEIGPGMGVLTQFLLTQATETWAIEVDRDSIPYLQQHYPSLKERIIEGDFLKIDFLKSTGAPLAIIGNFPYNISSQIFFRILDFRNDIPEVITQRRHEEAHQPLSRASKQEECQQCDGKPDIPFGDDANAIADAGNCGKGRDNGNHGDEDDLRGDPRVNAKQHVQAGCHLSDTETNEVATPNTVPNTASRSTAWPIGP